MSELLKDVWAGLYLISLGLLLIGTIAGITFFLATTVSIWIPIVVGVLLLCAAVGSIARWDD